MYYNTSRKNQILCLVLCIYTGLFSAYVIAQNQIIFGWAAVFAFVVFFSIYKHLILINFYSVAFSIIYTMVMISGRLFSAYETLKPNIMTKHLVFYIMQAISFFVLFLAVYGFFSYLLQSLVSSTNKNTKHKIRINKAKVIIIFLFTTSIYGIWLYILRPGIATFDSANQILQAMGCRQLANDNPFLHTLMMRLVLKPVFYLSGSIITAIVVYAGFSVLIFSTITTIAIVFIENNIQGRLRFFLESFYLLNPLVCWYAVTLWKDIWISYFLLLFIIMLHHFLLVKSELKLHHYICFLAVSLTVLFSKGTGVLYLSILLLSIIIQPRTIFTKKKVVIIILLVSLLIYSVTLFVAYDVFSIKKHSAADTESIIWQTLARTCKYHKNELTEDEMYNLNKFINVKKAGELYDVRISDPVKGSCIDNNYFRTRKIECIKTWLELGVKHPSTYLNAIYGAGYGYYYPEVKYWVFATDNYITTVQNDYYASLLKTPKSFLSAEIDYGIARKLNVTHLKSWMDKIREIPLIDLYASIGFYFMIHLFLVFEGKRQGIKNGSIFSIIPLGVFIGCIFSPVFAEMRYAYPAILLLPVQIVIYAILIKKKSLVKDD